MPDTVTAVTPATRLGFTDSLAAAYAAIRRDRRPLPAHDLNGCNARRWAAAVLQAEVNHADDDFWHLAHKHGAAPFIDRYMANPSPQYRFAHEVLAGAALNWLSHLQSHEAIDEVSRDRREWVLRRRYLVSGFVRQIVKYRAAREAVAMKEAA